MKQTLATIDSEFNSCFKSLLQKQEEVITQLQHYPFDLESDEITMAIVNRMDAFWFFHYNNSKELLGRKVNYKADDYLTETCLLYFKCYFEQLGCKVESEKKLPNSTIQPDISIWKNEKPIAVIELKVSNGWKGKSMIEHLKKREDNVQKAVPDCCFGAIAYWNFFETHCPEWGSKYIGLKKYNENNLHPLTGACVESLMKEIKKRIK